MVQKEIQDPGYWTPYSDVMETLNRLVCTHKRVRNSCNSKKRGETKKDEGRAANGPVRFRRNKNVQQMLWSAFDSLSIVSIGKAKGC